MRQPAARMLVLLSVIFGMAATPAAAVDASVALPVAGCVPWHIVPVPTDPFQNLTAIDGESPTDFWAVGNASASPDRPTLLHWDGTGWFAPPLHVKDGGLEDLAVISADDVWAVGDRAAGANTLIIHWDGSAWSRVPSPSPENHSNYLHGVSATSSTDVWAVGSSGYSDGLIAHWDGRSWSVVAHPPYHDQEEFRGVFAVAPDDAWVVGDQFSSFKERPIILHWDGAVWSNVPLPGARGLLEDVDGTGPNDVWAVGSKGASLVYRWNGTDWTKLGGILDQWQGDVLAVSAVTTDDVWAAGVNQWSQPMAAHWSGSRWLRTPVRKENGWFYTIKAFNQTEIWAGGGGIAGMRAERFRACS
jgi:hypothetical protein